MDEHIMRVISTKKTLNIYNILAEANYKKPGHLSPQKESSGRYSYFLMSLKYKILYHVSSFPLYIGKWIIMAEKWQYVTAHCEFLLGELSELWKNLIVLTTILKCKLTTENCITIVQIYNNPEGYKPNSASLSYHHA